MSGQHTDDSEPLPLIVAPGEPRVLLAAFQHAAASAAVLAEALCLAGFAEGEVRLLVPAVDATGEPAIHLHLTAAGWARLGRLLDGASGVPAWRR